MAQDHIWAPLAEGQPTHHREPGQMIYLQDTEAAQFYYILTGTVKCFISSPDGDERTLALHHGGSSSARRPSLTGSHGSPPPWRSPRAS